MGVIVEESAFHPERHDRGRWYMKITAEAPVRIDFAGAWTDVPVFYETFGGATLNAAIKKYVHGELLSGDHRSTKDGMTVHYEADLPWGAGLGSSASIPRVSANRTGGMRSR